MADERDILEELARALRPGPVEPPPSRVHALRRLVQRRRRAAHVALGRDRRPQPPVSPPAAAGLRAVPPLAGARPAPAATSSWSTASPVPTRTPVVTPVPEPSSRFPWGDRRVTMVFSGVAAAALLVVAAVVLLRGFPSSTGAQSERLLKTQSAAYRVQVALAHKDPAEVAKTDAEMLRSAAAVKGDEKDEAQRIAVPLHVQAIAFLRDHASPEVLSDVPGAIAPGATGAAAGASPPTPELPSLPAIPGVSLPPGVPTTAGRVGPVAVPPLPPSPTTTVGSTPPAGAVSPSVTITGITPRLDGPFEVNFTVSGFTPDPSGAPGSYNLRFSYDGGQDPVTYSGPSPWTFPLVKAILHRQVCAEVVDSTGAPVPDTSSCTNIINF